MEHKAVDKFLTGRKSNADARGSRFAPLRLKSTKPVSKGVVKAKKKGTCYIYAYAQNGVYKKIKITVK